MVGRIATGEIEEPAGKAPNRAKGGRKGAKVRSRVLTPEQRSEIARAAASARWKKGAVSFAREGHMKGLLRAILFGGGWSFGLLAIGLLVALPEAAQLTNREPIVIGVCSAIASALVFWTASRLSATHHGRLP